MPDEELLEDLDFVIFLVAVGRYDTGVSWVALVKIPLAIVDIEAASFDLCQYIGACVG